MSIKFTDLHDKMTQLSTSLITKEKFLAWCEENVEIKKYIPIAKKYIIAELFSKKVQEYIENSSGLDNLDAQLLYIQYDIGLLFDVLFCYADISVDVKHRTDANYDLVFESGFYDFMKEKCGEDYRRTEKICEKVSGINDFNVVSMIVGTLDANVTPEKMKEMTDVINSLDKNNLELLQNIGTTNPIFEKAIKKMEEEARTEVMKK